MSTPTTSPVDSVPELSTSLASTSLSRTSSHSATTQHDNDPEVTELDGNDEEQGEKVKIQGGEEEEGLINYRRRLSEYITKKYTEACAEHERLEKQRVNGRVPKVSGIAKMGSIKGRHGTRAH